jgi:ABC-type transport system involved in multi-copper enzyme maturation permease subunit
MLGGTLALLHHSLQLDGRLFRHHLYRLIFVGILYLFVLIATGQSLLFGAPGQWLFGWIAYLNFWFISLAGISYFATAISEEKETESLGILRMAGISPSALLLGKSTSRLIVVCLLLSLQFPFALLAITLGGVTTLQVFSVFVALLAYTAFVGNLALFCSVIARRAGSASVIMTFSLAVFFFVPVFANMLLGSLPGNATGFQRVLETALDPQYETSVFSRLPVIMATGFDESPLSFQVLSNLAAAVLFFVLSRIVFDTVTRYHSVASASRGLLFRPRGWLKFLGTGRVWKSALIWKDFHFITGGKPLLLLKSLAYGLLAVFACVAAFTNGGSNPFITIALWTIWPTVLMLLIESTLMASRVFREEVQSNALSSLMLLPTRPSRIAYAKVAGCLVALLPGLVVLGFGMACMVIAIIIEADSQTTFAASLSLFFAGIGILASLAFGLFFVHLVAYLSLVVKWGSIPMSIGISLVLVLFLCFMWPLAVFVFLGGAVGLHFMIGARFKQLGMQ